MQEPKPTKLGVRAAVAPKHTHELLPAVYDELRVLARRFLARERPEHTLQATALVHEVYLRLAGQRKRHWEGRAQFFAAAAQMIRRILVNHERERRAVKRGGAMLRLDADDAELAQDGQGVDVLALHDFLRRLAELDPRQALIVELRFFAGLTISDVADVLGVSTRTVDGEWALARAWLHETLERGGP